MDLPGEVETGKRRRALIYFATAAKQWFGGGSLALALALSGCSSQLAVSQDEAQRAVAASFSDCNNWESLPQGKVLIPGVDVEWVLACQSVAVAFAAPDSEQMCDYWSKAEDGPDTFGVSVDGQIIVFDLNGIDQAGVQKLVAEYPDLFEITTVDLYCNTDT